MCSHYESLVGKDLLGRYFRVEQAPAIPNRDMWPRRPGLFIRRPPEWESGDEAVPEREVVVGRWGLISSMTRADGLAKAEKLSTFNARSETAARSYTFGNAWRCGQHCITHALPHVIQWNP